MSSIKEEVSLEIDTQTLKERNYESSIAYTDKYENLDILTERSNLKKQERDIYKEKKRKILKENLFMLQEQRKLSSKEIVLERLEDTSIFTSTVTYLSLSEIPKENEISFSIGILFLMIMGFLGFILAIYRNTHKERGKNVY